MESILSEAQEQEANERIWLRVGETGAPVRAERLSGGRARLLEIPPVDGAELHDIVRYEPEPAEPVEGAPAHQVAEILAPGGFRTYLAWALVHQNDQIGSWRAHLAERQILLRFLEPVSRDVRQMALALPETLPALQALTLLNRLARTVEVICPLLAAHANEIDRAKADLERAVGWGAPDAELTYAVAEALERQGEWDAAQPFWERLANILPEWGPAHERLALNYAHLGVFPHAAAAFDRASLLQEDPDHRARLEAARDLMWERSRM